MQPQAFEFYSAAGQALLAKVHTEHTTVGVECRELIAFNDGYTGVETFERACAAYRQAFEDDDIAGMIRERPVVLQGLEQARARKQLLMQQTRQIAIYEQRLSDDAVSIESQALTHFVDGSTQTAIDELRENLRQLSQIAPAERGDIASKLQLAAIRIGDIDKAITSARAAKTQAEQTHQALVEREGAARSVLDAATEGRTSGRTVGFLSVVGS